MNKFVDENIGIIAVTGVIVWVLIALTFLCASTIGILIIGFDIVNVPVIWNGALGPIMAYKLAGIAGIVFWTYLLTRQR